MKRERKRKKAALFGCGLLENSADLSCSAWSSDMAQPVIVAAATTAGGMALGPSEDHGMRPYSRTAGHVKIVVDWDMWVPVAARFVDHVAIVGATSSSRIALGSPAIEGGPERTDPARPARGYVTGTTRFGLWYLNNTRTILRNV
jgi:hypothetical protein